MGNAMPSCLVDQGAKALLPATKPNRRMYSLNLLTKALHRMKKTPCGDRAASTSKTVIGKPPPEAEVGGAGAKSVKASYAKASPRRAAAAARGGGHRKGVVRVKVLLSKEEAARLLSLTVGGQKNAAQIVAEIKRMEARRAAASSHALGHRRLPSLRPPAPPAGAPQPPAAKPEASSPNRERAPSPAGENRSCRRHLRGARKEVVEGEGWLPAARSFRRRVAQGRSDMGAFHRAEIL
jgi:hypothetical protein